MTLWGVASDNRFDDPPGSVAKGLQVSHQLNPVIQRMCLFQFGKYCSKISHEYRSIFLRSFAIKLYFLFLILFCEDNNLSIPFLIFHRVKYL